jgi:hypothetical protein
MTGIYRVVYTWLAQGLGLDSGQWGRVLVLTFWRASLGIDILVRLLCSGMDWRACCFVVSEEGQIEGRREESGGEDRWDSLDVYEGVMRGRKEDPVARLTEKLIASKGVGVDSRSSRRRATSVVSGV